MCLWLSQDLALPRPGGEPPRKRGLLQHVLGKDFEPEKPEFTARIPFQNETWISNRDGSIFLICDQSDLERHPLPVSFWDGYILVQDKGDKRQRHLIESQGNPLHPGSDNGLRGGGI